MVGTPLTPPYQLLDKECRSDLLAKLAMISSVGNYWNCGSVKKWITLMSPYIQKLPQEFILLHMMLTVITLPITEVGQRHVK